LKGRSKPRKLTPTRGEAHIVYTALRGDGSRCPFYVQTNNRHLALSQPGLNQTARGFLGYVPRSFKRPGEAGFKKYLEYLIQHKVLKPRSLLIFDGEKAFTTPLIQQFMRKHKIYPFPIRPSLLHQLLNPCDNSFHSVLKAKYNQEISDRSSDIISIAEKMRIAESCYYGISKESVVDMFKKCGIFGGNPQEIVAHSVNECIKYSRGKSRTLYQTCLLAFVEWCFDNKLESAHLQDYQKSIRHIQNFLQLQQQDL